MRQKFVDLVKEYIRLRPDNAVSLDEIKTNVESVGATEEEFNEALRQMMSLSREFVDRLPDEESIISKNDYDALKNELQGIKQALYTTQTKSQITTSTDVTQLKNDLADTKQTLLDIEQKIREQAVAELANKPQAIDMSPFLQEINALRKQFEDTKTEVLQKNNEPSSVAQELQSLKTELQQTKQAVQSASNAKQNNAAISQTLAVIQKEIEDSKKSLQNSAPQVKEKIGGGGDNTGKKSQLSISWKKLNDLKKIDKKIAIKSASFALTIVVIIFSLVALLRPYTKPNSQIATQTNPFIKTDDSLVAPVYANSLPVDAGKVFSYPPSNISLVITGKPKKQIVGFFPYWMLSNQANINLDELTTINLFGITVDGKGNIVTAVGDGTPDGGWVMWNDPGIDTLIARAKKKGIKVNLVMKCFNQSDIENLVSSDDAQKRFISNALYMLNSKNLNGINIDFEYVGNPKDATRDGFTRFITNLQAALIQQVPNATLTVDTYVSSGQTPGIFDISGLSEKVDQFVIMGYDVHTPSGSPGSIAPMQGDMNLVGYLQSYLEKVPPDKIILAVPYYGYDWPLGVDNTQNPAAMVAYAQVAQDSKSYKILWDNITETPWYTYTDSQNQKHEVHFENVRSLGLKYDYINEKDLSGVGIWALGYDGLNTDLEKLLADKFNN